MMRGSGEPDSHERLGPTQVGVYSVKNVTCGIGWARVTELPVDLNRGGE